MLDLACLGEQFIQAFPRVDACGMPVAPKDLDRVAAHRFDLGGVDQDRQGALADDALAGDFINTGRARALAAQEASRVNGLFPRTPADLDVVRTVAADFQRPAVYVVCHGFRISEYGRERVGFSSF